MIKTKPRFVGEYTKYLLDNCRQFPDSALMQDKAKRIENIVDRYIRGLITTDETMGCLYSIAHQESL